MVCEVPCDIRSLFLAPAVRNAATCYHTVMQEERMLFTTHLQMDVRTEVPGQDVETSVGLFHKKEGVMMGEDKM